MVPSNISENYFLKYVLNKNTSILSFNIFNIFYIVVSSLNQFNNSQNHTMSTHTLTIIMICTYLCMLKVTHKYLVKLE